jgi:3-deoxy-D-manno-octulosonate 8-phosphate phosphatase (KDO 8-P phosphatase)
VSSGLVPQVFVLDVDGVMTDGKFYYTADGKFMKIFGADDNDALSLLKKFLKIHFVTGDKVGFPISQKRIVDDMKYPLDLVSTVKRIDWISERWDPKNVIYMGDGIFDHYVFAKVGYSIAPASADAYCKSIANFVTERSGGDRSVSEACLHILSKFFEGYQPHQELHADFKASGRWQV